MRCPFDDDDAGHLGPAYVVRRKLTRGKLFVHEDGTPFPWHESSEFRLYERFIKGEDITPVLRQRQAKRRNVARVFFGYDGGIGVLRPLDNAMFYAPLPVFLDLANSYGICVEATIGDCQIHMPRFEDQLAHSQAIHDAFARVPGNFQELCNEPFKNGMDVNRVFAALRRSPNVLVATGNYDLAVGQQTIVVGDYMTYHSDRKADHVRGGRALDELHSGFDWIINGVKVGHFDGAKVPVVDNEPTGYAEVRRGDSRLTNPDEARQVSACRKLFGPGACFHSDDGINARLFGPITEACMDAWAEGEAFIPSECITAGYMRGDANGGAGVGNMPLQHFDAWASRSYCKDAGDGTWRCVACQPIVPPWQAIALRGTIVDEPGLGLVGIRQ